MLDDIRILRIMRTCAVALLTTYMASAEQILLVRAYQVAMGTKCLMLQA